MRTIIPIKVFKAQVPTTLNLIPDLKFLKLRMTYIQTYQYDAIQVAMKSLPSPTFYTIGLVGLFGFLYGATSYLGSSFVEWSLRKISERKPLIELL